MNKKLCSICEKDVPHNNCTPFELINIQLVQFIQKEYPHFKDGRYICNADLHRLRILHLRKSMEADLGEISSLESNVLQSLKDHETISENMTIEDSNFTFADRLSDKMASFGGSWTFIISFGLILLFWISINSIALFKTTFDPFPFIFLNLLLSCIAAIQAPVIMMSQNRQEAKDRARAENDYKINLKAELEIRHIKSKVDQLASHQWRRLMEIEETQAEILNELKKN